MEQYGPEGQLIVLDFHGAVQFLDRCIEDIDNQMMQYYLPMEETDESQVDSAEMDNILDKVEGLEKDGRLVSVRVNLTGLIVRWKTLDAILLKMIFLQIWRWAMIKCFMQDPGYRKTQYR